MSVVAFRSSDRDHPTNAEEGNRCQRKDEKQEKDPEGGTNQEGD